MAYKYTDDDYCDIYENKICDNCGKCLEMEGIDTKAVKIEDIAKSKEEKEILEEEFFNDLRQYDSGFYRVEFNGDNEADNNLPMSSNFRGFRFYTSIFQYSQDKFLSPLTLKYIILLVS